jgi:hypothetical protein
VRYLRVRIPIARRFKRGKWANLSQSVIVDTKLSWTCEKLTTVPCFPYLEFTVNEA